MLCFVSVHVKRVKKVPFAHITCTQNNNYNKQYTHEE